MPRINFWKRDRSEQLEDAASSSTAASSTSTTPIRDAERRRLSRLLTRRSNIEFDLSQAETAFMPENRWNERIEQLDAAIRQAGEDLEQLSASPTDSLLIELPSTPIHIEVRAVDVPSEILIRCGDETLLFREEVDWAERGHQVALPNLMHVEGHVTSQIPDNLSIEIREQLIVHLHNSFSIIANDALSRASHDEPMRTLALSELTKPCTECGGWLDPLSRCPACTELEWRRKEFAVATARLIDERNDVMAELDRTRERLPVFRRQLQDVDRDIEELRAKGVTPHE